MDLRNLVYVYCICIHHISYRYNLYNKCIYNYMICVDGFSNSHIPHSDRITDNHPNNFVFVVSYWWDVAARHNHHPILWILKAMLKHPHFCHCNLSGVNKNANVAFEGLPLQKIPCFDPPAEKKKQKYMFKKKTYLFLPQQAAFSLVDDFLLAPRKRAKELEDNPTRP